ncbi:hypothetical protein BJX61DRAFT_266918 [Aspergillus egyptiacus]|nr:hypothetical protein BJX61DRAFT_266918 [Aspergillus egyptiacus]
MRSLKPPQHCAAPKAISQQVPFYSTQVYPADSPRVLWLPPLCKHQWRCSSLGPDSVERSRRGPGFLTWYCVWNMCLGWRSHAWLSGYCGGNAECLEGACLSSHRLTIDFSAGRTRIIRIWAGNSSRPARGILDHTSYLYFTLLIGTVNQHISNCSTLATTETDGIDQDCRGKALVPTYVGESCTIPILIN